MAYQNDPYAAGGADDVFVAPPTDQGDDFDFAEPPGWPKVVGIISIIWGALGLVCGGAGIAWQAFGPGFMQGAAQEMEGGMPSAMTTHNVPLIAATVFGTLWSLVLIVAGAMSANRKFKARVMHLVWAVVSLIYLIVSTKMQLDMQMELAEWIKANPNSEFAQQAGARSGGIIGLVVGIALGLAWPVFCLIWFGFVKTKPEQMTGGVEAPAA